MKMVCKLAGAILMLLFLAPVASARVHHHSSDQPAEQSFPEMTIVDEWSADLIVAPPVTRPSGSVYDTPKPRAASFAELAPAPVTTNLTSAVDGFPTHNAVPTGGNPTGENPEPATSPSTEMV